MSEYHSRSFAKSISWRVVSFLNTSLLGVVISGNAVQGLAIGVAEILTKTFLFYFHERLWLRVKYGRKMVLTADGCLAVELHTRTFFKMLSWRAVGTLDTLLVAYLITGNLAASVAISLAEFVTELALYYIHERSWLKVKWGIKRPVSTRS